MEHDTFLEHYRLVRNYDGSAQEQGRTNGITGYRAVDTRSDQPVDLKLVPMLTIDAAARPQFEDQARAALLLDHVNIAKLLAFGAEYDHYVLVSESLEGETVEDWIKEHGPIPPEAALRIALQVISALGAASFHNVRHHAIQPGNLLIVPGLAAEGGWPFVKLTNFGLAPAVHAKIVGATDPLTSAFASPEQLTEGVVDFRSEVYSLGATMCFLLTASLHGHVMGLAKHRSQQIRRLPRPLRPLLQHMLHQNPAERPQDPLLLVEEIRACASKIERRQAISQRLGVFFPLSARNVVEPTRRLPLRGLAIATVALAALILAAFLIPEDVVTRAFHHKQASKTIGVPVGIPERAASSSTNGLTAASSQRTTTNSDQNASPVSNQQPAPSPAVAAGNVNPPAPAAPVASASPFVAQSNSPAQGQSAVPSSAAETNANQQTALVSESSSAQTPASQSSGAPLPDSSPVANDQSTTPKGEIASNNVTAEPPPPSQGPEDSSLPGNAAGEQKPSFSDSNQTDASAEEGGTTSSKRSNSRSVTASHSRSKTKATTAQKSHRSSADSQDRVAETTRNAPPRTRRTGTLRARVIGTTPEGRLVLRLPSGKIAFVRPRPSDPYGPVESHRPPRAIIERPVDANPPPPYQPFELDDRDGD
ncbi:MAG: serine/threonine protein kinase [Spartobacteria bacterium]|nr:serine/threonine protein kinase [Spartobacteria bacterium]